MEETVPKCLGLFEAALLLYYMRSNLWTGIEEQLKFTLRVRDIPHIKLPRE
jgi:hypothetical protein